MRSIFALVLAVALAACSSSGTPAPADGTAPAASANADPNDLHVVVNSRATNTVAVFVLWRGANRTRLGDIGPGRTRTWDIPYRGTEVALLVDDTNAPPTGTAGIGTAVPTDIRFAAVNEGDVIEFTIVRTVPTVQITHLLRTP